MFAKSIVLSDAFLDMPLTARCLYFTLGMLADDDGFVGNPKAIMRQCGASQDDMAVLLQKRFILAFESGVIVIKHWRMNNYLRNDRHNETTYKEELALLKIDNKGAYTEKDNVGIPGGRQVVYPGKYSIDKSSIDNNTIVHAISKKEFEEQCSNEFKGLWDMYPRKQGKTNAWKAYLKARLNGAVYSDIENGLKNYIAYIKKNKTEARYIKMGSTWFNQKCWEDSYDNHGGNQGLKSEDKRPFADQETDDWFFNRN